jgi:hypothetical protein
MLGSWSGLQRLMRVDAITRVLPQGPVLRDVAIGSTLNSTGQSRRVLGSCPRLRLLDEFGRCPIGGRLALRHHRRRSAEARDDEAIALEFAMHHTDELRFVATWDDGCPGPILSGGSKSRDDDPQRLRLINVVCMKSEKFTNFIRVKSERPPLDFPQKRILSGASAGRGDKRKSAASGLPMRYQSLAPLWVRPEAHFRYFRVKECALTFVLAPFTCHPAMNARLPGSRGQRILRSSICNSVVPESCPRWEGVFVAVGIPRDRRSASAAHYAGPIRRDRGPRFN